jgi:Secretion system C-terminal sorting domain
MVKNIICLLSSCTVSVCCLPQAYLHLTSGTNIKLDSGVVVDLYNTNLIVDGTLQQSPGDGTFLFTGAMATTISGSSLPVFDKLLVARGTGNTLSLQHPVSVVSQVVFTSGLLDLNNNNLNLGSTGLLMNESDSSRIIGPLGGEVIATATLNAPSAANPGNLGAIITSSQNLGSTTIRRGHQSQVISGTGMSILRYFDIAPTNDVGLNAGLSLQYFDAELNGLNADSLKMWSSSNDSNWMDLGYTDRDTSLHYVELTGIDSFSRWTLYSGPSTPLPLTYLLFNASCLSGQVSITWETAQQVNTRLFEVERSGDGSHWQVIGTVPAAGNSSVENEYSFIDKDPLPGNNEYRIAEYDLSNQVNYTQVILSTCAVGETCTVWPNPVANTAWVNISSPDNAKAALRLYDSKGALMLVKEVDLPAGNTQYNLDLTGLARGSYELRVDWGTDHRASVIIIKL